MMSIWTENGTAGAGEGQQCTLEEIKQAIELIKKAPIDPIRKMIQDAGADPDKGAILVVPEKVYWSLDVLRGHPLVRPSALTSSIIVATLPQFIREELNNGQIHPTER